MLRGIQYLDGRVGQASLGIFANENGPKASLAASKTIKHFVYLIRGVSFSAHLYLRDPFSFFERADGGSRMTTRVDFSRCTGFLRES